MVVQFLDWCTDLSKYYGGRKVKVKTSLNLISSLFLAYAL